MDIPTPTPLPPVGTPAFNLSEVVDGAAFTQQVAMEGVQWWHIINQYDIISYAQLALLIGIVVFGIVMIINALNDEDEDDEI